MKAHIKQSPLKETQQFDVVEPIENPFEDWKDFVIISKDKIL